MTSKGSRLAQLWPLLTLPVWLACSEDAPSDEQSAMVTPSTNGPTDGSATAPSTEANGPSVPSNGSSAPNPGVSNSQTPPGGVSSNGMGGQGVNTPGGLGGNNGSQGGSAAEGGAEAQGGASMSGGPSQGGAASEGGAGGEPSAGGTVAAGGNDGEPQQGADCSSASLLFCEDFEGAALGGVPDGWTAEGDVEVTADGHSGGQALRSNAQTSWRRVIRHDASSFGAEHWGRIYYRVQMPVTTAFVHSTFVAFTGDGPTIGAAEYRVVDTVKSESDGSGNHTHQFLWNVQPEDGGEFGRGSDYNWSFDDQWHCAEWFVSATTQAYRFFIDGEEVTQVQIDNGAGNYGSDDSRTDIPDQFNDFWVGFTNYQDADPGFVAWVDDVAIGTARVGCN